MSPRNSAAPDARDPGVAPPRGARDRSDDGVSTPARLSQNSVVGASVRSLQDGTCSRFAFEFSPGSRLDVLARLCPYRRKAVDAFLHSSKLSSFVANVPGCSHSQQSMTLLRYLTGTLIKPRRQLNNSTRPSPLDAMRWVPIDLVVR